MNRRHVVKVVDPGLEPGQLSALQQRIQELEAAAPESPRSAEAQRPLRELRAILEEAQNPTPELFEVPVSGWYRASKSDIARFLGEPPARDCEMFLAPINHEWFFLCTHVPSIAKTMLTLVNAEADGWFASLAADAAEDALQWARGCFRPPTLPGTQWHQQQPRERQ